MTEKEALAQPEQEPVAKPYAYEYGRCNADGTYSVVIEKGDLVQTSPAVYNYVRPRNAHKDWPIKELFDRPPQRTEQEPVAWQDTRKTWVDVPLKNVLREKRTWVGLTEQEHTDIAVECGCMSADWVFYGAAVERKVKERNQ